MTAQAALDPTGSTAPTVYDHETDEARLARRLSRWTPTVLVETSPSA